MHLKLRECKEDYMKVGETRQELNYRKVKIMCPLEGGYTLEGYYFWHFKDVLTWMHKNHAQGWLKTFY